MFLDWFCWWSAHCITTPLEKQTSIKVDLKEQLIMREGMNILVLNDNLVDIFWMLTFLSERITVVPYGELGDDRRLCLFYVWLAEEILIIWAGHTSDELACDHRWEYPDNTFLSSMQRRSLVRIKRKIFIYFANKCLSWIDCYCCTNRIFVALANSENLFNGKHVVKFVDPADLANQIV